MELIPEVEPIRGRGFQAYSTRVTQGHATQFFTTVEANADAWAEAEAKSGYRADVYVVEERIKSSHFPEPVEVKA